MERHLAEVLENKEENYILPFFWQHGESGELLEEGMEKIYESGIKAVCVESRPHPDFAGEGWWRDLDRIMAKAKELGMRVWVLDDAHFPSGYANGKVKDHPEYGKTYLTHYTIDAAGPRKGCSFMVRLEPGEEFVAAVMGKRSRTETFVRRDVTDVTDRVRDGKIRLDIPEGVWAVDVIKTTKKGTGRPNYINSIDADAVKFFIDTVYEPHYSHYKKDFGKTFAGFFSDEPEIGNCGGEYIHDAHIGQPKMPLPWSRELSGRLKEAWGKDFAVKLLSLWVDTDPENAPECHPTGLNRRQFMDLVTELYGTHFCGQIGEWCRARGVEYIGHVIEDGGSHAHLGLGTGHFFKALWGEDMSGIDVVLQQIRPELDDFPFYSIGGTGFYHGEFFHYGLAKMGVSLGELDPKKKGRTMCEVFGAYGWAEGLKLMKWIIDHMLVNGVNYFVPHAFTMKDFPDPDCPPHFYARGNNPQYPYFKYLMEYTNRVSHLLNGGHHQAEAALLYTAEQEWMGPVRKFEKDARVMTRNQVDFLVVPEAILAGAAAENGELILGKERVKTLVIPGSRYLSAKLAGALERMAKAGVKVIVTEELPECMEEDGTLSPFPKELPVYRADEKGSLSSCSEKIEEKQGILLTPGEMLGNTMKEAGLCGTRTSGYEPWLRTYHYVQEEGEYRLFFTESITSDTDTELVPGGADPEKSFWYDPWTNRTELAEWTESGKLKLSLKPGEMKILCTGAADGKWKPERISGRLPEKKAELDPKGWKLFTRKAGSTEWQEETGSPVLGDLGAEGRKPYFSGTMRYETEFEQSGSASAVLDLGEVYESAEVFVNGKSAGVRVTYPYRFDLEGLLREGTNRLSVVVTNTLVHEQRDHFSMTLPMEPSGLIGPCVLYTDR